MARHTFRFEGGEDLTTIGVSFLVSFLYHKYVDPSHDNWRLVKTYKSRISTIERTKIFHKSWLEKVESMDNKKLEQNKLKLDAMRIKKMAREILKRM